MLIDEFMKILQKKYPDNSVSHKYENDDVVFNIDETEITCNNNVFEKGYDEHGMKFINAFVDMLESYISNKYTENVNQNKEV